MTKYQLVSNSKIGFGIIGNKENTIFQIWIDKSKGGDATINDWNSVLTFEELKTFDEAYEYIINNYGEIKKI